MEREQASIIGNTALRYQVREIEGSNAMNFAHYESREREFSNRELHDDIVSYLGEYRLNIQKYTYRLKLIQGKICDEHKTEPMTDKAQRAIDFKKRRGENPSREEAELFGIQSIEEQLRFVKNQPATLYWMSPQGPKEEGFGEYGFTFVGNYDPFTSDLSMTAIRIENPTIAQFNKARFLLTGKKQEFQDAVGFLMSPMVLRGNVDTQFIDKVLQQSFSFKNNMRRQEICQKVLSILEPKIEEFIKTVRYLPKEERLRLFHTLENYAISVKERYEKEEESEIALLDRYRDDTMRLYDLSDKYGYKPPTVSGSCGSSGNIKSNNPFSFGEEWFTCPKCGWKADGPIDDGPCGGCGLTKEQYAKESGKPVCE